MRRLFDEEREGPPPGMAIADHEPLPVRVPVKAAPPEWRFAAHARTTRARDEEEAAEADERAAPDAAQPPEVVLQQAAAAWRRGGCDDA